ncbi:MAG: ribosome-associated translation inhibitor RaiA [Ignavibacteriae bacterium]|nr:ribosome-associated translation inhibitor RaiA [Ignavibacteriota bacterium]
MDIQFTARRFRAHPEVKAHAIDEVRKLGKFYDGILSADIILSYERGTNSVKTAEVNLHVFGVVLSAREKSDDYYKSIDAATGKLSIQLKKYKSKLRAKDKNKVRSIQAKV